jgi:diadenosine tetraphosphate (Ap4A) HIT family hydrolase
MLMLLKGAVGGLLRRVLVHRSAGRNAALRENGLAGRPAAPKLGGMFEIDPAFLATSQPLGDLALSHVRLQGDARFPWIVLIPRVDGARELEDLAAGERDVLMDEILQAGSAVRAVAEALGRPAPKLNVGQLGNITAQLHVHVIARRPEDAAWPAPVWGFGVAEAYGPEALEVAMTAARAALGL